MNLPFHVVWFISYATKAISTQDFCIEQQASDFNSCHSLFCYHGKQGHLKAKGVLLLMTH